MVNWIFFNKQLIWFSKLIENEPLFYSLYIQQLWFFFGAIEVSRKCKQPLTWTNVWLGQTHAGYLYRTMSSAKHQSQWFLSLLGFRRSTKTILQMASLLQRKQYFLLLLSSFLFLLQSQTAESRTLNYKWEVKSELKSPDCFKKLTITINGRSPGPTIYAHQGDTVIVELKNSLHTENVAIHWHGIRQVPQNFHLSLSLSLHILLC